MFFTLVSYQQEKKKKLSPLANHPTPSASRANPPHLHHKLRRPNAPSGETTSQPAAKASWLWWVQGEWILEVLFVGFFMGFCRFCCSFVLQQQGSSARIFRKVAGPELPFEPQGGVLRCFGSLLIGQFLMNYFCYFPKNLRDLRLSSDSLSY